MDGPSKKDRRRGRAAANIIPTSTGSAKAVGVVRVLPVPQPPSALPAPPGRCHL